LKLILWCDGGEEHGQERWKTRREHRSFARSPRFLLNEKRRYNNKPVRGLETEIKITNHY
jgi:hypothetical protein